MSIPASWFSRPSSHRSLLLLCLVLFCSLATLVAFGAVSTVIAGLPGGSVRKVDFSEAPEMKELAGHARQIGDDIYPQILALLAEDTAKLPRQFGIVFKRRLTGDNAGGTQGTLIELNSDWFARVPDDLAMILVHEMTHVAQQPNRKAYGKAFYWTEGMADYVCFKFGRTNDWVCPECSAAYPHYTSGYTCSGAFLLYLDAHYGSNIVRRLNAALHRGTYSDQFFVQATGRTLETLWTDFQQTPAFTPAASETLKFQKTLGFVNGKPPKDLPARLKKLPGWTQTLAATDALKTLVQSRQLPGLLKGDRGNFSVAIDPLDVAKEAGGENYPILRTFHCRKSADPSLYHYTLARVSEDVAWKLQKAWRTSSDGRMLENFSIPETL
jgi:Peptidase of plants and bacteria